MSSYFSETRPSRALTGARAGAFQEAIYPKRVVPACVIRSMSTSESGGCRPPNPEHAVHFFGMTGMVVDMDRNAQTCGRPLAPVDKSIWPATKVHRGTATVRVSNALYGLQTCLFGVYFIYPAPLRGFFREKWWPAILMWSTGQVGFVALFEYFSGFEFFLLPSRIHARPHAGNANR